MGERLARAGFASLEPQALRACFQKTFNSFSILKVFGRKLRNALYKECIGNFALPSHKRTRRHAIESK
jgi:hypothetical protein